MTVKCPHCNRRISDHDLELAENNCLSYAESSYVLQCPRCNKKYMVRMERRVALVGIVPVPDSHELSFG